MSTFTIQTSPKLYEVALGNHKIVLRLFENKAYSVKELVSIAKEEAKDSSLNFFDFCQQKKLQSNDQEAFQEYFRIVTNTLTLKQLKLIP